MIFSILTKKAIKSLSNEHPIINKEQCINELYGTNECILCKNVCEKQAIIDLQIDYSKCIDCNLCTTLCPTQTILPSNKTLKIISEAILNDNEDISISCFANSINSDIKIQCIAALPWEIYVVILLSKKISMNTNNCKNCALNNHVNKRIKEIKTHFECNKRLINIDNITEQDISRRDLFFSMKKKGKTLINEQIVIKKWQRNKALVYRNIISTEVANQNFKNVFLYTLEFGSNCWACGLCVGKCPNNAIEIVDYVNIKHLPYKCTMCGLCKKNCTENGIQGWRKVSSSEIDAELGIITKIEVEQCPHCFSTMRTTDNKYFCYYCGYKQYK